MIKKVQKKFFNKAITQLIIILFSVCMCPSAEDLDLWGYSIEKSSIKVDRITDAEWLPDSKHIIVNTKYRNDRKSYILDLVGSQELFEYSLPWRLRNNFKYTFNKNKFFINLIGESVIIGNKDGSNIDEKRKLFDIRSREVFLSPSERVMIGIGRENIQIVNLETSEKTLIDEVQFLQFYDWIEGTENFRVLQPIKTGMYSYNYQQWIYDSTSGKLVKDILFINLVPRVIHSPDMKMTIIQEYCRLHLRDNTSKEEYIITDLGTSPEWSPGCRYISYLTGFLDEDYIGDFGVAIFDLKTRKTSKILDDESEYYNVLWVDASHIICEYESENMGRTISIIKINGSEVKYMKNIKGWNARLSLDKRKLLYLNDGNLQILTLKRKGNPDLFLSIDIDISKYVWDKKLCLIPVMNGYKNIVKKSRLIRNEIFARHGYEFNTPELQDYFGNKEWYEPNPQFNKENFNSFEKENIKLLKHFEDMVSKGFGSNEITQYLTTVGP